MSLVGVGSDGESVRHWVVVDGVGKRVYDSAERCALQLRLGVIQLCVRDGFTVDSVEEVRTLVVQQHG